MDLYFIFIDIPDPHTINPTGFDNPLIFHLAPAFVVLSLMSSQLDGLPWNLALTNEL